MLNQINNAFANLDERMHTAAIEFAKEKKENYSARRDAKEAEIREKIQNGEMNSRNQYAVMFNWSVAYFGSKGLRDICLYRSMDDALNMVTKNTQAKIDRRNAQIMNALSKKGVTEIPEFELVEYSDGLEGYFDVAGHNVHIRTILAGGYNIQCLHARTLVKIK